MSADWFKDEDYARYAATTGNAKPLFCAECGGSTRLTCAGCGYGGTWLTPIGDGHLRCDHCGNIQPALCSDPEHRR